MNTNMLGEYLRRRRGSESLRSFAQKCGISHTHLESIEKGEDRRSGKNVCVSMETLRQIGEGIGVDPLFLAVLDSNIDPFRVTNIKIPSDWPAPPQLWAAACESVKAKLIENLSDESIEIAKAFDMADERTKEIIRLTLHDLLVPPAEEAG